MKTTIRLSAIGLMATMYLAAPAWADDEPVKQPDRPAQPRLVQADGGDDGGLSLLPNEAVQKELKLEEEQTSRLRKIGEDLQKRTRELFEKVRDADEEDRRELIEKAQAEASKLREDARKRMEEILRPEQRGRLGQIARQMRMQWGGTVRMLTRGRIAEELEVTDEQRVKIENIQREHQVKMQKEMERMQKESREEILGVLTPEQKEKYKEMVGDDFDFSKFYPPRRDTAPAPRERRTRPPEERRGDQE